MNTRSHDYEASLVLSLLLDQTKIPQCDLSADEFGNRQYAEVYSAITALSDRGDVVDLLTVSQYLHAQTGRNWLPTIKELSAGINTTRNIEHYTQIVRKEHEHRKAAAIGQHLAANADGDGAIDTAIRDLMALSLPGRRRQHNMNSTLKIAVNELDAAYNGERKSISTGLIDLDDKLGGLHNGDLVVIGARPAMGKTALLLNMALAASAGGHGVGLFSGEQDIIQMGQRLLSIQGKVPVMRMRNGKLLDEDWPKVSAAVASMKDRKFITDDTPSPSLSHVVRSARSWKYGGGVDVIFLDYLQRMHTDGKQKRFEAVGENVRGLKNLARELNIPIVVLAQVNRTVESKADKRPNMGDLADSSEIEKEADQIFMLYRDEVYNPNTEHKGLAEILVEKNRHGPTGFIRVIWRGECLRFENLGRVA